MPSWISLWRLSRANCQSQRPCPESQRPLVSCRASRSSRRRKRLRAASSGIKDRGSSPIRRGHTERLLEPMTLLAQVVRRYVLKGHHVRGPPSEHERAPMSAVQGAACRKAPEQGLSFRVPRSRPSLRSSDTAVPGGFAPPAGNLMCWRRRCPGTQVRERSAPTRRDRGHHR